MRCDLSPQENLNYNKQTPFPVLLLGNKKAPDVHVRIVAAIERRRISDTIDQLEKQPLLAPPGFNIQAIYFR